MTTPLSRLVGSVLILLGLVLPPSVYATAQEGDILILDGTKHGIQVEPLEGFLEKNPGKLPKSNVVSTSNWRGYVATWEVKDGRLLLIDLTILRSVTKPGEKAFSTERESVMSKVFPGEKEIEATWFTGHIVIPNGRRVTYVHMGYASTFEKYIILRVQSGTVIRRQNADTAEFLKFRDEQFKAFKKTEEYREAFGRSLKEEGDGADRMSRKDIEEFLREFYSGRYLSLVFDGLEK